MESIVSITLNILFLITFIALVLRILADLGVNFPKKFYNILSSTPTKTIAPINLHSESKQSIKYIFLIAIVFRLLNILVPIIISVIAMGETTFIEGIFIRWDGYHYLNLIENGYAGAIENGQHLFLVFFPLYVWIVRIFTLGFINPVWPALFVSTLCFALACCYLYKFVVIDYGEKIARRSVLYISIFPFAFFFGEVMTESLFFLTTASSLYYIRKHKWGIAGIIGIFSALTRMHGLLLIIPAGIELCSHYKLFEKAKNGETNHFLSVLSRVPLVLLPLIGTGIYLLLNYYVDGNPFAFLIHQEHWAQGAMWFSETITYMLAYIKTDFIYNNPIFIPQLFMFAFFSIIFALSFRKHKTSYIVFAFATLILNFSLAWLLSAGRYMSCSVIFFIFMATLVDNSKPLRIITPVLMIALYIFTFTAHLNGVPIM